MRRRQVVSALALLAAGSAGCANTPSPTPSPPEGTPAPRDGVTPTPRPLEIPEFATSEGSDGNLVVDLVVHNPADRSREAELLITATYDDSVGMATRDLALEPDERRDLSVTVPVSFAEWEENNGSLDFSFEYR